MLYRSAIALALLPFACSAQQVFKCVDGDATSYQSTSCEGGQVLAGTWSHGSYAPPAEADLERTRTLLMDRLAREDAPAMPGRARRPSTAATPGRSGIGRCDQAKAHRDRELYKAGMRVSMERRRSWDARVAEACRW